MQVAKVIQMLICRSAREVGSSKRTLAAQKMSHILMKGLRAILTLFEIHVGVGLDYRSLNEGKSI